MWVDDESLSMINGSLCMYMMLIHEIYEFNSDYNIFKSLIE